MQEYSGLAKFYDEKFYGSHDEGSLRSGRKFAALLAPLLRPQRVVDVGCGRGTWLKAFHEQGAAVVVGLDGEWNSQAKMVDPAISFQPVDLNSPGDRFPQERFDLAISLEVAEHLSEQSAPGFVRALAGLADVVLFSAAYKGQGGANHVNEQPHTYWAAHFASLGYVPFDLFRPVFWGDSDVYMWYQQNAFLYVKSGSGAMARLRESGYSPLSNVKFLDCVHPSLYDQKNVSTWKRIMRRAVPPGMRAMVTGS